MKKTVALAVQTKTAAKGDCFHRVRPTLYMEGSTWMRLPLLRSRRREKAPKIKRSRTTRRPTFQKDPDIGLKFFVSAPTKRRTPKYATHARPASLHRYPFVFGKSPAGDFSRRPAMK